MEKKKKQNQKANQNLKVKVLINQNRKNLKKVPKKLKHQKPKKIIKMFWKIYQLMILHL